MVLLGLACLLQNTPVSAITVWESIITVERLCDRLSAAGLSCKAVDDAAGKYVTIFAKNCSPLDIAVRTADAIGFVLKRRGSSWLMTTSPAYERAKALHESEVKKETNLAFDQLVRKVKADPPPLPGDVHPNKDTPGPAPQWTLKTPLPTRKREFREHSVARAHWSGELAGAMLLAHATEDEVRHLKNGHIVVGSCPPVPGTVPLPGKPSHYQTWRKDSQIYIFARWMPELGLILTSDWNFGSGGSAGALNVHNNDSQNEIGKGWTTLWDQVMAWAGPDFKRYHFVEDILRRRTYASTLELIARQTGKFVVSESSPRFDYPQPNEFYSAQKLDGSWMLFKPSHFQSMAYLWRLKASLESVPEPDVNDVAGSIDWSARYCLLINGWNHFYYNEPFAQRNRLLMDDRYYFSKFWLSLSTSEKRDVLSSGIRSEKISGSKRLALMDALLELMQSSGRTHRVEAYFDPSFRKGVHLRIETRKGWGYESDTSGGFGSRPETMPRPTSIPPTKNWWPVEGFWCYLTFTLEGVPEAEIFREFKVTRRGAPIRTITSSL